MRFGKTFIQIQTDFKLMKRGEFSPELILEDPVIAVTIKCL